MVQTPVPLWFLNFFPFFNSNKKIIEILTKTSVKITIIVVENREETYYFIIICKCKEVPLSLFYYHMLASTLTTYKRSIYYKVYIVHQKKWIKKQVFPGFLKNNAFLQKMAKWINI